jgi:hypothetical protein
MSLLDQAAHAFSLLQQGREALVAIKDAISDGTTGMSETDVSKLKAMLDAEEQETRTAIADARDAIAAYRAGD